MANSSSSGLKSRSQASPVHGQAMQATEPGMAHLSATHAPDIAAMDLFVVPTIGFDLLYALVIVRLDRRTWSASMSQQTRRQNGLLVE
jgi:hypothetical protein